MPDSGWLVAGTGRHADWFGLPALGRARGATIAALCGSDAGRTAAMAARHLVPRWDTSIEALLSDPAVSHVYVCSGNADHARQCELAASAGRHVLCEKPLAPDAGAAQRIVDACRRHGVVLGTGFHLRHNSANERARRLIAGGAIGDPLWLCVTYLHALGHDDSVRRIAASRQTRTPSKGAMAGTGTHAVDLARWLLGDEITAVSAAMAEVGGDQGPGPQRAVHVTGLSAGGVLVTLTAGRAAYPANGITVLGTRGQLAVSGSIGNRGGGTVRVLGHREQAIEDPPHDVYQAQFEAFAAATANGGPASASGADGVVALAVAEAVERSLAGPGGPQVPVGTTARSRGELSEGIL